MNVERFINFDEFWTPSLIKIVYVIGVIVITIFSLAMLTMVYSAGSTSLLGFNSSGPSWHFEYAIGAVLLFIFGNLYWRVLCEIVMLIFKINDHATSIDDYFKAIKGNS